MVAIPCSTNCIAAGRTSSANKPTARRSMSSSGSWRNKNARNNNISSKGRSKNMPELPDVEVLKQYVDATSLHQPITGVDVRAEAILEDTSPEKLSSVLHGSSLEQTARHGKHLFIHVDDEPWLGVHFGMTGFFKYFRDEDSEPPHTRLVISFDNGYHLAYDSQRKLGKITLIDQVSRYLQEQKLGPDALSPAWDFDAFASALEGRRGMVKTALMNQEILAGIGNIYADEILFHAGISPKSSLSELDEKHLRTLFETMTEVLQTAVDCRADPAQLPDSFLLPHREEGAPCPRCGGTIATVKVSGRTSYYCPACQQQF
ncbi:Fpg/Nei family DNA glycosylase [candidate division KSB3 bacterium]|uniref:Fpg/Nei family DNA glycosylase n=1 Tax=candidate division KSB3 bacterium TaxID=2044937 RepID=A0A9D5JX47_9BACT|nr:Fpg/Nei family DNA glycosylase [candidate division KSB3 bacterium]MBD3325346.1 Fpg/Nei family DNA glycosylase [candidate division KSB3 bacterium]